MKKNDAKYIAVAKTLKSEILGGKYESHVRFPSEGTLVRRFGVSRPTIERALRELKREGLLESKAGSGSFLTFTARNATGVIGIIVPDYKEIDFFTRLSDAIAAEMRESGYNVLLGDVSASETTVDRGNWAIRLAKTYAQQRVAGVLLEPMDLAPNSYEATKKILSILTAKDIPVILLDRDYVPMPERSSYDLIGIDNFQTGYRIAQHLLERGAKRICFATPPNYANTIRARIHGVAQAALDAGRPFGKNSVIEIKPDDIAGYRKLMRGKNAPDAFICRNDHTAAKLIQTLSSLGISVPNDVRIAGFDDGEIARLVNPPLTTIRQPVKTLAKISAAALIERIRRPSLAPRAILLDAELVVRSST